MNRPKDTKELVKETLESFKTINDCLSLYYKGKQHMFKPIAGQLRILYCDRNKDKDNSLLHHIYPDLKLIAIHKYEFTKEMQGNKVIVHDKNGNEISDHGIVIRPECYIITEQRDGLQIADLDLSKSPRYLSLQDWCNQLVDMHHNLSVQEIIRSVADKGGGAHLDIKDNQALSTMKRGGPAKVGLHILFIIALARFTMKIARQFATEWIKEYPELEKE